MTSPFAITTPDTNVVLTENRLGEMRFIVTNMTDQPLQGRATVVPLDSAPPEWFSLASKAELNLRPGATAQVVVRIEPPLGVPPARHLFRVDVVNATAPEAAASVGPSCAVVVPPSQVKANPWKTPRGYLLPDHRHPVRPGAAMGRIGGRGMGRAARAPLSRFEDDRVVPRHLDGSRGPLPWARCCRR